MNNDLNEHKNQIQTARIAGIWYLSLAISGIVGFMIFHAQIYVLSSPEQTLTNLTQSESIAKIRLIFELLIVLTQALTALWFYKLFKPIGGWQAWSIGIWGMINSAVILISSISMASAIVLANSPDLSHEDKVNMIAILVNIISHSWVIGGIFFGLWLIPMGQIVITSKAMPLWLGRILIIGGFGYILKTFIYYWDVNQTLLNILTIPATIGEFWMIGYLLIFGIRPTADEIKPATDGLT